MKRILIILCLLVSLPVFASEWKEVVPKRYITIEKFDKNNAYVYYWLKSLNDGSFSKIKGQKVNYTMTYFVEDCNNNKGALISNTIYGMNGSIIENWSMSDILIQQSYYDFVPIIPNTYGEAFHKFVCKAYNNSLQNIQTKQQTEKDFSNKNDFKSSKSNYFSIGSTKKEVLKIQGQPTSMNDYFWKYGYSKVDFKDGRVSGYNNWDNNLKIKVEN